MMEKLFRPLLEWYQETLVTGGYWLVALLMAIESSIVPLPSEVVIPPAAHLAYTTEGGMTVWGVALAGTIGSWVGATIMYWAARWAGRPLVLRFGKYILISPAKVEGAERWATKFGSMGVFMSRLLPVVRHLIGIPAGIVRMNYVTYSIYTLLGSGIWCGVLCWVGIRIGQDLQQTENVMHTLSRWLAAFILVIGALYYFFVHRHMKAEQKEPPSA